MSKISGPSFRSIVSVFAVCAACAVIPVTLAGPFVCDYEPRVQIGTIAANQSPYLNEASGLAQSRKEPDVFWSHQDNGNDERIFAIHRDGRYLGTWDLAVNNARDPEDIAIGPGPIPGVDYVYYGDVGHNYGIWGCTTNDPASPDCAGCPSGTNCRGRDLVVWRAVEPDVDPDQSFTAVGSYPADTITLKFPDAYMLGQRQDVEAMMVDPLTRDIYIATKRSSPGMVFRAPYPQSTSAPITMEWVANLPFGGDSQATGGDISADGRLIIIRRYGDGYIWQRPDGTSVGQALAGTHCRRSGLGETQGEAVAFDISSSGTFYTTSEGGGSVPIYLYRMVDDGCVSDEDCSDGLFCNGAEVCAAGGQCQSGLPPTCPGQLCSEPLANCVDCLGDTDCGTGEFCDVGAGVCQPEPGADPLPVEAGDIWRYHRGSIEPPPGWSAVDFDDSAWAAGAGGFGYGSDCDSGHGTTLADMRNSYVSVYLRMAFSVESTADIGNLTLTMDYDDAFVAYLNGQEVARSNVIGNPPISTQLAAGNHECSGGSPDPNPPEEFDLNTSALVDGVNVLAIQGHNLTAGSSDFSLIPSLRALAVGACIDDLDCDDGVYCNGAETCSAGVCQSGSAVVCDDGVSCTTDSCNEASDSCNFAPVDSVCDDGQFCNGAETCDAAQGCRAAETAPCDGALCDETSDQCVECLSDGDCDDGVYCNGAETCSAGVCQSGSAVVCDDGVACTTDSCNEASDSCNFAPVDSVCDDGQFCNGAETCDAAQGCRAAETAPCDGALCDETSDQCVECLSDEDCDDGVYCNGAETCSAGVCQSGSAVVCDDGVSCTTDRCNEASDSCNFAPVDSVCDDGQFCNGAETCDAAQGCQAAETAPCDGALCDETSDQCVECLSDGDCDDGVYCNGAETCSAGVCQSGSAVVCDDGVACTSDSCNEASDSCNFAPVDSVCDDGQFCNGAETCDAAQGCQAAATGPCVGETQCDETNDQCVGCLSDGDCDDGLYCNGAETCSAGVCQSGSAVVCDDGVACTTDSCNEASDSCNFAPVDSVCDDGQFCNGAETCDAAQGCQAAETAPCAGTLCDETSDQCVECLSDGDCDDGVYCNGAETCSAGVCQSGSAVVCDDGVACTSDSCNEASDSCNFAPVDSVCDDGLYCNGTETCDAAQGCQAAETAPCAGTQCDETSDQCVECLSDEDCDDSVYCNGAETCSAGVCQSGSAVVCDDGIACTTDSCNEASDSCNFAPMDSVCDDGQFCNGAETCDAAQGCRAAETAPCAGTLCDETNDQCVGCLTDEDCDDGVYCNGAETCSAGVCQSGSAVVCDDGVVCTTDSCNEASDSCNFAPVDSVCDDGQFCNGAETCDVAQGCQAAETAPCAGTQCDETNDQCVGCLTDGDCDDGVYCNGAETCSAGVCQSGIAVVCDDGIACTTDSCNEASDSCNFAPVDSVCDDGQFCNGAETCDAAQGCQAAETAPCEGGQCNEAADQCMECLTDVQCDDGDACTADRCEAGSCVNVPNDGDGDLIPDCSDNCPADYNPDQLDFDGDSMGDICEYGARAADINHTERVEGFDLTHLARAFSSSCGDSQYDARADLNRNCFVDGLDLAILATHFGTRIP